MAPPQKYEFLCLKIKYSSYVHPEYPRLTCKRRRHSPNGLLTRVDDWYRRTIIREMANKPPNQQVRFVEWNVRNGNPELFIIDGFRFDKIQIILGEEELHWVFYQSMKYHRRVEGSGPLNLNYCSCCIKRQYHQIMESVRGYVDAKGACNKVIFNYPTAN